MGAEEDRSAVAPAKPLEQAGKLFTRFANRQYIDAHTKAYQSVYTFVALKT